MKKKLISAYYGKDQTFINVSDIIKNKIKNNQTEIEVTNKNIGGDPCPGVRKQLLLFFDDDTKCIIYEGNMFSFDGRQYDISPSNTFMFDIHNKINRYLSKKIKNAYYGNSGTYMDVTTLINNKIKNNETSIHVTNVNMEQDPASGIEKNLLIIYEDGTKLVIPENGTFNFAMNGIIKQNIVAAIHNSNNIHIDISQEVLKLINQNTTSMKLTNIGIPISQNSLNEPKKTLIIKSNDGIQYILSDDNKINCIDMNEYLQKNFVIKFHKLSENITIDEKNILRTTDNYKHYIEKNIFTILNKPFVLIIDYDRFFGGATFFLNTIISYLKKSINFIIVRQMNSKYYIYVNDESEYSITFNSENIKDFINGYKDNITKIFVNSIIGQDEHFINYLFSLNKFISTITHDYSLVLSQCHPWYQEINNYNRNYLEINYFNEIITQNIANLYSYHKFIGANKNITVTELPDYTERLDKINTGSNEKIIVGIIGMIYGDKKGLNIINELQNQIETYDLNMEIFVFGNIQNNKIKQVYYKNIYEFNDLLAKIKPNLFVYTSSCPETYSYTLTIEKLTDLPIFYKNYNFYSVVQNRLENYDKAYQFDDVDDLINKINLYHQDYLYSIKPVIHLNEYWANMFIDKENLVLVTSKIENDGNLNKTIATIDHVKKYIPDPYIMLIDNSDLSNNLETKSVLTQMTDLFINPSDNLDLYNHTKEYNASAEIAQILYMMNTIKKYNFKYFFKISAGHIIDDNFDYAISDDTENIFSHFYKISKNNFTDYYVRVVNKFIN